MLSFLTRFLTQFVMPNPTRALLAAALVCCAALSTTPARAAGWGDWNDAVEPFPLYGNSYYVGVEGLSAALVTSPAGHILIDGGLPESAQRIAASVRQLGFRIEDVKLILTSHAHVDHAGGLAELQRMSGAAVLASPLAALALRRGKVERADPQASDSTPWAPLARVRTVRDGQTVTLGGNKLTAHFTPGHTPGGLSWSWRACDRQGCANIVYADSINPIAAAPFKFSASSTYPAVLRDFERSFKTMETLPCDILVTVHPNAAQLWEKMAAREAGKNPLLSSGACKAYAELSRTALQKRLAEEGGRQ
jgi:metallo-beta-lactamase class B